MGRAGSIDRSGEDGPGATKPCAACGRPIEWRRRWARCWSEVRFCSDACRSDARAMPRLIELDDRVAQLLRTASAWTKTPDLPQRLGGIDREVVRRSIRRLSLQGLVECRQGSRVVDPADATGDWEVRWRARRPPTSVD